MCSTIKLAKIYLNLPLNRFLEYNKGTHDRGCSGTLGYAAGFRRFGYWQPKLKPQPSIALITPSTPQSMQ